jgi:hypothetical protein
MRNTPLHESHLLEAVRRKILSSDQMEQVLALARSSPGGGDVADVRWATVVQGLIAAAAVMGSGIGILVDTSDHGADLGTAIGCAAGLGTFLALAHMLDRYSWGRVPGSILRAGAAVWSFGVMVGLLSLVMPLQRYVPGAYSSDYFRGFESFRTQLNAAYALSSGASALVALGIWRARRCGPALGVAGAHVMMAVAMLATSPASHTYYSSDQQALIVMLAGGALFAVAFVLDRLARGPVDGAFWLYPAAMFPMGIAGLMRIDRHEGEVILWLPLALALGAAAYANGRRFPLLFSAMAAMIFPAFAMAEAHAPSALVIGTLIASAVAVAVAVQLVRARDLRRVAAPGDAPSIWS